MTDIVEFLTARLDEDEAAAEAASYYVMRERWHAIEWYDGEFSADGRTVYVDIHGLAGTPITHGGALRREDGEHIARHNPARVLAEVKAKRRMLELAIEMIKDEEFRAAGTTLMCNLAAPHDQHPDYDPAWRVE